VDLYSVVNAALCGFFAFASIHYLLQWSHSRSERLLLVFGLSCAANSLFCPALILLTHATTVQQAQLALTMRIMIGAVANSLALVFLALVDGRRNRVVVPAVVVLLFIGVLNLFMPLLGEVVSLRPESLSRSVPVFRGGYAWLLAVRYITLVVGYGYGLSVARHLWTKDRAGSILVGMGAGAYFVNFAVVAPLIDFAHVQARYVGTFPMALFVLTMAIFLSREYSARGTRLVTSERLFSSAFEYAPIGMTIAGLDGAFLKVNRALCDLTGFAEPELLLRKWGDITHPDDHQKELDHFNEIVSGAAHTHQSEVRFNHKDGHDLWGVRSLSIIRDHSGHALHVLLQIEDVSQRRKAELALRESEERFRTMFVHSGSGMALVNMNGRPLKCNPALQAILGYSDEELCAMSFTQFTHPDDATSDWNLYQDMVAGRRTGYELEKRYITKDGCTIWGQLTVTLVRDDAGAPMYAVGMVQDITVRKKVEDALKERERRFATIFRESPVALGVAEGSTGKLMAVNPEFLRLYGATSADQVLGKATTELGLWTAEARNETLVKPLLASQPVRGAVATLRRLNGETRAIEFWASSYDIDGKQHLLVSNIDVTDRQRAEKELREREQQFRQLFEGVRDVVFSLTPNGEITTLNPAFERITGLRTADWIGKPFIDLIHPDDRNRAATELQESLDGHPRDTQPLRIRASKGYRLGEINTALRIENGRPVSVLGIGRDVSERVDLENQLRQAQKMQAVGRLAGGVAHDFNNLLTIINGYSEILMKGMTSDNPIKADLQEILNAGKRAAGLTRQLLIFSRKQVIQPVLLNLNSTLSGLEKMLVRLVGEDINLSFVPTQSLRSIVADPGQIEQAVVNLVVNARDAMPLGGRITIKTANVTLDGGETNRQDNTGQSSHVMIAVSDTGTGMSEDVKAHLFEPFFTTKAEGKGTGLGLSTVNGIVKQCGGKIKVSSELGKGTTFEIYLQQSDSGVAAVAVPEAEPEGARGKETVLVAEDQESVRRLAQKILEASGYSVLLAKDGTEALRICEDYEGEIRLLLTDVVMRSMTGGELARVVARIRPETSILFMSGYTERGMDAQGLLHEETLFIQKPFSADDLRRKVREVLDLNRKLGTPKS